MIRCGAKPDEEACLPIYSVEQQTSFPTDRGSVVGDFRPSRSEGFPRFRSIGGDAPSLEGLTQIERSRAAHFFT